MIKNGCCDTKIFVFVHKSYTKCAPYFECLSGMENVINKPCLCQLEQAICCLPKPLSEQRKQIFLVERGAESPTGQTGAVFSPAPYLCTYLCSRALANAVTQEGGILFCVDDRRMCVTCQWLSRSQKTKPGWGKSGTCMQANALCAVASTPFPAFLTCWLSLIQCHVPGKPRLWTSSFPVCYLLGGQWVAVSLFTPDCFSRCFFGKKSPTPPNASLPPPPTSLCPDGNYFFFVRLSNPFLSCAIFHHIVIGNLRRAEEKGAGLRPSLVIGKQSLPLVVK